MCIFSPDEQLPKRTLTTMWTYRGVKDMAAHEVNTQLGHLTTLNLLQRYPLAERYQLPAPLFEYLQQLVRRARAYNAFDKADELVNPGS